MLSLWKKLEDGKLTHAEARVHIGFARTVLDTLKVEIAAAHLSEASLPHVPVAGKRIKAVNGRRVS
jgi:hypothetical protein